MTTTAVQIPFPEVSARHLKINVGACRLVIRPGSEPDWVCGSYVDPVGVLPLRIECESGQVRISQEFNPIEISGGFQGLATLELQLGKSKPYWLAIKGGVGEGDLDLGGLPISRLLIRQAVTRYLVDFSEPNPQALTLFKLAVAGGGVEARRLGNANLVEMQVEGGAADCSLQFGASWRRDVSVRIEMGLSQVELIIPASAAAKITPDTALGAVEPPGLVRKDGALWTPAARRGRHPLLKVHSSSQMGSVKLRLAEQQNNEPMKEAK